MVVVGGDVAQGEGRGRGREGRERGGGASCIRERYAHCVGA